MKYAGALLAGVAASVTCAAVLAFPLRGLCGVLAWASFVVGLAVAITAFRGIRPDGHARPSAWDVLLLAVFALASLRAFLWLIYPVGDEWRVLSPNNLGDIALHLNIIRYLASGVPFWPTSPILAGVPFTYPLGADLFNALLALAGIPVEQGLVWAGLLGAFLTAWALWQWGGGFALAAFLFNGGLAGFAVLSSGHIADFQADLAWKNFFLAMLVTQRGLLYALPCGLFLLAAWRDRLFGRGPAVPAWVEWLLYATLPLFNVHAFLFLSLTLAVAFFVSPQHRLHLLLFVASAFVPATAALFFVTGQLSSSPGIRWLPGWMQGDQGFAFWVWNFGASLPLLLLLAFRLWRHPSRAATCFAGTGLVVFLLCSFVSFAPWEWDNTKLFLWAWLACAPALWSMISPWPALLRASACFLLFFSGAVSLAGGLDGRHGYKLASRSELAIAAAALADIPPHDRIAVEPDYNNPVILLGRPVVCGYEGHLWSHGLNYRKTWDSLQAALHQAPGWQKNLQPLGARWLFLSPAPPIPIPPADNPPPPGLAPQANPR